MTKMIDRYGPWALVAGGAQGIGAAFSQYAVSQGLNVVVIDNSQDALNVTGPMVLSYHFRKSMLARRSGGIILMSSGAGRQDNCQ